MNPRILSMSFEFNRSATLAAVTGIRAGRLLHDLPPSVSFLTISLTSTKSVESLLNSLFANGWLFVFASDDLLEL